MTQKFAGASQNNCHEAATELLGVNPDQNVPIRLTG